MNYLHKVRNNKFSYTYCCKIFQMYNLFHRTYVFYLEVGLEEALGYWLLACNL